MVIEYLYACIINLYINIRFFVYNVLYKIRLKANNMYITFMNIYITLMNL